VVADAEVDAPVTRIGTALALALLLTAGVASLAVAGPATGAPVLAASTSVTGNISGPSVVGYGTSHTYFLNATGGPAFAANGTLVGNLTWYASLAGSNLTGVTLTPSNGTIVNATPVQTVLVAGNVTEPVSITVLVASVFGTENVSANFSFALRIVQPYVLTLHLVAGSGASVLPFNLTIFLDGTPVGTLAVPAIRAGAAYTAVFDYPTTGLASGSHTFTASLVAQHGLVTFAGGATTYTVTFYVTGPPPNYTIWYVAGAVAFFGAIFIFLTRVAARRRTPTRK
jgi:hypothetical protein